MESVKSEAFFMSERASLFLSSIGLLGEYFPTSRKKSRHSSHKVGCMHLGTSEAYTTRIGCLFMRPFPIARNLSVEGGFLVEKDNTTACSLAF